MSSLIHTTPIVIPAAQCLNDIVFLIVLFKKLPEESSSYNSLLHILADSSQNYQIILFDNTPEQQHYTPSDSRIAFVSTGKNQGLPAAYNYATRQALQQNREYIALFDQDSFISSPYLYEVLSELVSSSGRYAVYTPRILSGSRLVSPFSLNVLGLHRPLTNYASLYAINSFSVIAVKAIEQCGFFDEFYWLDALDLHFFHKLQQHNFKVKVLNAEVEHSLSLVSGPMEKWRLNNIARYEMVFYAECLSFPAIAIGFIKVIGRGLKRSTDLQGISGLVSYCREALAGIILGLKRRYSHL